MKLAQDVFASCAIGFALKKVKVSVNVKVELLFICNFANRLLKQDYEENISFIDVAVR